MAEVHLARSLEVQEAFRGRLGKVHPQHPHLAAIDVRIEDARARLASDGSPLARNFTSGALKDIKRAHGVVFDPFETSLAGLRVAKRPLWISYEGEEFMNLVSRPTQVAIFPHRKDFYVPESNNLSLPDQGQLLEVDLEEVIKKKWGVGGMDFAIGDVATHAALPFAYLERPESKGVRLHGRDYDYKFARTDTPTVGSRVASVGYFFDRRGLYVRDWRAGDGYGNVWAVRLGVPAQE